MSEEPPPRVEPYEDELQEKTELKVGPTYQYEYPFNYRNVDVDRSYYTGEQHGLELQPVPEVMGGEPSDRITIEEEQPIVRVAVIGSACTAPGWIALEADPVEGVRRETEPKVNLPVRFRETNLWGQHIRGDAHIDKDATYKEHPNAGMSCATFEIPKSERVEVFGGSETPGWRDDNAPSDIHYSFRQIRVTVTEE
jgi:hypothetical protein